MIDKLVLDGQLDVNWMMSVLPLDAGFGKMHIHQPCARRAQRHPQCEKEGVRIFGHGEDGEDEDGEDRMAYSRQ